MSFASTEQVSQGAAGAAGQTLDHAEADWGKFAESSGTAAFPALWLALLCSQIGATRSGLVLLGPPDRGPFTPAGIWPDASRDLTRLTPLAERALRERRGAANRRDPDATGAAGYDISYPLVINGAMHGVVILDVGDLAPQALQQLMQQLHWGVASLELELTRRDKREVDEARQRVFGLLDLVSIAVEEERFQSAAATLVSELATRLDCDRVSLGMRKGRQMRVQAISHSATFGRQMNLVRLTEAAMDEAVDQETRLWFPNQDETKLVQAHQDLAQQQGAGEICTIPIAVQGGYEAALTIERPAGRRLREIEADFCETLGEIAAPMLVCKREHERWLPAKIWQTFQNQFARLFGADYLGRKLVAGLVLSLLVFFYFAKGDYRVAANATLEGGELRALVAPFNGYIDTAAVRAGERVDQGALLATLDDRDLQLEQVSISTELAQYRRERRQAAAEHDRAKVRILTAQIEQANAQLELVQQQLARTQIRAPFAGVVVSGDLSQALGAPVQQGEVLFELAPAERYRVRLAVNERDINDIALGQRGQLVLSALPETPIPIEVSLITPVTQVIEGANSFEVEAALQEIPANLRPGMEGIGKVAVDQRRLIWIWTRSFVQWLRLQLWAWLP